VRQNAEILKNHMQRLFTDSGFQLAKFHTQIMAGMVKLRHYIATTCMATSTT